MDTKSTILLLLEQNRGKPVSGGKIAEMLGISRNAVWKAISSLKSEGYSINAVSNRGYTLASDSDILSCAGIANYLADERLADKIHIYKSLESTNKTAVELAIGGAEHGTVVIADSQTDGKGRYDKHFYSPPKTGLYMSVLLRSKFFDLANTTNITKTTAVAVCKTIEKMTGVEPEIKPVNDIFLNGKKICGILTEAISDLETGYIDWAVVGIGINITTADFPDELQAVATSIFLESAETVDATFRSRFAAELINFFISSNISREEIEREYEKRTIVNLLK